MIDDPQNLNIGAIKLKALTFSWEFMFARSMSQAHDMDVQGKLLTRVAELVDGGKIVSTVNNNADALSVDNLRSALSHQESGGAIGKTVLDGVSAA